MEKVTDRLLSWASILDEGTLEQARRASEMPFVFPHLALMPDAHLGKGATVGSVIPTVGAVMPAAVGVDIGCVDGETEYLSPAGWRRIDAYDGGPVMQYDPEDGHGVFVEPLAYVVKDAPEFLRLRTKYGVDQMLTPDHRVLCWRVVGRDRRRVRAVMSAEEFAAEHARLKLGIKAEFETSFSPTLDTKLDLSDEQVRVQVMVSADAHLQGDRAVLNLKKSRKLKRAYALLIAADIDYTMRAYHDRTVIRFTPPVPDKSLRMFWTASADQLALVAEECLHWDGNLEDHVYFSRERENADLVHYAVTASGRRGVLRADPAEDGKVDYRVFSHANTRVGMAGAPRTSVERVPNESGKAYCFTLPSGYWVMRRGGNVAMTGNCGMIYVRTQVDLDHVRDELPSLTALREEIERAVPLSAGRYNQRMTVSATARVEELLTTPGAAQAHRLAPNWPFQLGSLGSGNHFIEVTVDESERLGLFLHSGSRGVGNKIAMHHIGVAQQLMDRMLVTRWLPDRDLAYLPEGTSEFDDYVEGMRWAQRFAWLNREEMMDRVVAAFERWSHRRAHPDLVVNCHHNYTERERHFGKTVWLTRKGAIDAHEGVLGLIPGSMGAASYVVAGRGDPLALHSSPHGAGRVHSRSAAKRLFTHEQLRESMAGIEWRDSEAFLDEHPQAYKRIGVVMADAADLVEVRHTLRQIVNVKGS